MTPLPEPKWTYHECDYVEDVLARLGNEGYDSAQMNAYGLQCAEAERARLPELVHRSVMDDAERRAQLVWDAVTLMLNEEQSLQENPSFTVDRKWVHNYAKLTLLQLRERLLAIK